MKSPEPKLNGVVLDHLRKLRGEQEDVFEGHKYYLTVNDLEKLIEGCKQKDLVSEPKSHLGFFLMSDTGIYIF
jgi:hypothetical protein